MYNEFNLLTFCTAEDREESEQLTKAINLRQEDLGRPAKTPSPHSSEVVFTSRNLTFQSWNLQTET